MTTKMFLFISISLAISLIGFGMAAFGQHQRSRGLVLGDRVGTWMSDDTCSEGDHVIFGFTDRGYPVIRCE